jgi:hypothetical protein
MYHQVWTLNPAIRVQISVEPKRIFLFLVNYSLHIVLLHDREGNMMCMSDAVSVNIVHNFPKMYVKGKGTELLFISNRSLILVLIYIFSQCA